MISPVILIAGLAAVSPSLARNSLKARTDLQERATTYCDVFNAVTLSSDYILYQNLFDKSRLVCFSSSESSS